MTKEQAGYIIGNLKDCEEYDPCEIQEAKAMAIDALWSDNWIPVSERLPEEQGIYLTYIINEYDNRFQYPMTACFSPNKVGCLPQWFPDDETASNNVVAWMPLPKRYEPQKTKQPEISSYYGLKSYVRERSDKE